jgi:hypothetical protein
LVEINWGLPNRDCVWGHDCNPLEPLITVKRTFLDGWNTGYHDAYPRFHYYLVAVPQAACMVGHKLAGNLEGLDMEAGYPYGVDDFDTIWTHLALIFRFLSVLMALGAVFWVYKIGEALWSHRAGLFAGAIVGLSPSIVYYAHTETLDVPMLFWLAAALYCYVRVLQTFEVKYYVWLAILAAVSTATKDYAYGAFVLMPIPLVWCLARHLEPSRPVRALGRAVVDRRHWIALAVFVVSFALAENWVWNFAGFANHVKLAGGLVEGEHITTSLGRHDLVSLDRLRQFGVVLPGVMGGIAFALSCVGAVGVLARRPSTVLALLWPLGGYYAFSVVQVLDANSDIVRPFIPVGFLLALFGGWLLASLWGERGAGTLRRVTVGALVCLVAANAVAMDLVLVTDTRYQAESWLREHAGPGCTVEMYGYRRDLPRSTFDAASRVVNHKLGGEWGDALFEDLYSSDDWTDELESRSPGFVVVSRSYSKRFVETAAASKHSKLGEYSAICDFFDQLVGGRTSYVRVRSFEPQLAQWFGFGHHIAPEIEIYQPRAVHAQ